MREIPLSAEKLVSVLLALPKEKYLCLLDSGVSHLGSRYLIAGFEPVELSEIRSDDHENTLKILDEKTSQENLAAFLTISYEFGLKLNKINPRTKEFFAFDEPDVFLALFDCLIVHDYLMGETFLTGNEKRFDEIEKLLNETRPVKFTENSSNSEIQAVANFTREDYLSAVARIQEYIRRGDTYQTNLTQQIRVSLPEDLSPEQIFDHLRRYYPAPFAAFIRRENDAVVSQSPERFFQIDNGEISVSPIKGTRRRGKNFVEDERLKNELLTSEKDCAENVMIVDLLRNDIGRICEYGSVTVEKLFDLETHPTLHHLVSTVRGKLRENVKFSDVLQAIFPCGSITGAPKIRTMQVINEIETARRNLSMGAIGCSIPVSNFEIPDLQTRRSPLAAHHYLDFNVAIRTMVVRDGEAVFNVGGGIVIDSDPQLEYEESLLKAKALLKALRAKL